MPRTDDFGRQVNPAMVSLARNFREMTQTGLAERTGLRQGTVSKIEGGMIEVTDAMAVRLSRALDVPVSFFYQTNRLYGLGSHEYAYRKRQSTPARVRKRVEATVNLMRIHTDRLLESIDLEPDCVIPQVNVADTEKTPEDVADDLRVLWHLPSGPVDDMTAALEHAGVVVIACHFGTSAIDATSVWLPTRVPLVFINEDIPGDRWRFTLAHELGHLVMHPTPEEDMEAQADQFASAFLMPKRDIAADLYDVTLKRLANIKPYWKVSIQALIERAFQLGRITPTRRRSLYVQLSRLGYRKREPVALPRERPTLHRRLFDAHTKKLEYTLVEVAALFAMHPKEVRELYPAAPKPAIRLVR